MGCVSFNCSIQDPIVSFLLNQMFKHLRRKIKLKNVTQSFDDSNIIIKSENFLVFNFMLLKELK